MDGSPGSNLRVGNERVELEEGRMIIFDDSFEHEAWNDASLPRIVLIFDIWHPDFSPEEVKFLEYMNRYEMRALRRIQKESSCQNNFLSVIERGCLPETRDTVKPEDIWGK